MTDAAEATASLLASTRPAGLELPACLEPAACLARPAGLALPASLEPPACLEPPVGLALPTVPGPPTVLEPPTAPAPALAGCVAVARSRDAGSGARGDDAPIPGAALAGDRLSLALQCLGEAFATFDAAVRHREAEPARREEAGAVQRVPSLFARGEAPR